MGARIINAALGLWLFFSTFLWPHTRAQRVTGWVVGALAVTAALASLSGRTLWRSLSAALGGWLIASAMLVPRMTTATFWNDLVVGVGLVVFAATPSLSALRRRRVHV